MFVELVYDKRNVDGLAETREITLVELTKHIQSAAAGNNSILALSNDRSPAAVAFLHRRNCNNLLFTTG